MTSESSFASKRRSSVLQPWLIAAAIAGLAFLAAWGAARGDRAVTRAHAENHMRDLAHLQAEMTESFLDRIDQSLRFIGYLREREGPDFDLRAHVAQGRIDAQEVTQFGFIGADGIVTHSTLPFGPAPVSVADRAHFRAVAVEGRELYVAAPVLSRVSNRWTVQILRAVRGPDGGFLGAAMAGIDVAGFGRLLDAADGGATITLVGADGFARARNRDESEILGRDQSATPLMDRVRQSDSGGWEGTSPWSGQPRAMAWRKLDGYPLYAIVSVPPVELAAGAGARARFYWAAASLLALAAFLVAIVDASRRARADAALAAARAADAEKTRLLLSLGAELRHPVEMLRWSIDALSDPTDETARKRALADLRLADAALGRAIDDAAELARLMRESEELDLSVVDARLFARGAFEVARARAGNTGIVCDFALDLPEGLRILADEIRLRRVADTLLGAAFERAGRGGRVGFSVGARGLDRRNVEIAIAVTASGEEVSAHGRENGVAAALAQKMGGRIERLSAPGGTLDVFKAGFSRAV